MGKYNPDLSDLTDDGDTTELAGYAGARCKHCGETVTLCGKSGWTHDGTREAGSLIGSYRQCKGATTNADAPILRLRIEPDDADPFEDSDFYGQVASVHQRENAYGHRMRPSGFDGNAEKLSYGRGDAVWWQPCVDGPKRGTAEFKKERALVLDLLEFGHSVVFLEVLDGHDAYGRPIVTHSASMGGIEPAQSDSYKRETISELWADLAAQLDDSDSATLASAPELRALVEYATA